MLLRDHPLMSRNGVPNWPPIWTWIDGLETKSPKGEIGILKWVALSGVKPPDRCYLCIDYEGSSYMGCLLFDNLTFCHQIVKLLKAHCNRPIGEIGGVDLSGTL